MASTDTILTRLLTSLSLSDPTWDISVGSATYKIMESVAQELSNVSNNSTLLTYGYDVNSKTGTELDAFVNLFGINRQLGTRATGTVTFSTNNTASQTYDIPLGTQVYASSGLVNNAVTFSTTSPAIITSGQTSAIVPIIATLPGTFANLPATYINQIGTPLVGVVYVTNEYDLTNGTDTESDEQLKKRFFNTAFSNFSGTAEKFAITALQDPNVNRVRVIGPQQRYTENLQIITTVTGNGSTFQLGLNTKAKFSVVSGSNSATLIQGSIQPNVTIPIGTADPAPIYSGNIFYNGTEYILTGAATTGSGYLTVNYTVSGNYTTLSGLSTPANLVAAVSGVLNGTTLNYGNSISVLGTALVSGFNSVVSGVNLSFSQGIPWNVVVSSGGATITTTNNIISQIPDSMYCYPQGNELVGLNVGTNSQILLSNATDYNYIRASGAAPLKLKITFNPNVVNAPYTFTGQNIQLQSEYIPTSSRITITGNALTLVNPNYVDIYIDGQTTQSVTEQVIFIASSVFTASGSGGSLDRDHFLTASGAMPTLGDNYINLTQGPLANFPAQLVSGSSPSAIQFGQYSFPLVVNPTTAAISVVATGSEASNTLYTTSTAFADLQVGLVASGVTGTTISGVGPGNYITELIPGNPNQIKLNNNLLSDVNGTVGWVTVAYPVYDNTIMAGSIQDITGIGFRLNDPTGDYSTYWPVNSNYQSGSFVHSYYSDVVVVDNLEQQSRTVGTDVLVHQAQYRRFIVNLSLIYDSSISSSLTNASITNAIGQYFNSLDFGGTINLNSLIQSVYSVNGVWGVHLTLNSESSTSYGLQEVTIGKIVKPGFYTQNIILNSNELPILDHINFFQFGQNNF